MDGRIRGPAPSGTRSVDLNKEDLLKAGARIGSRMATVAVLLAGLAAIVAALVVTPDVARDYISADGVVSPRGFEALRIVRVSLLVLGCLLVVVAGLFAKYGPGVLAYLRAIDLPLGTMLAVLAVWVALAIINLALHALGLDPGTSMYFPISVFGPKASVSGLPYSLLFLAWFVVALRLAPRLHGLPTWLLGLSLVVLGNLAQGGVDEALRKPVLEAGLGYYYDAIEVSNWLTWLREFNASQAGLLVHSRTHPPFAVLIHHFLLRLWGGRVVGIGASLAVLSSLSIALVWRTMRCLGLSVSRCSRYALLFSVLPAFNIYSAVSLDGFILTLSTMFLLGTVQVLQGRSQIWGAVLATAGMLLTNCLSFGGVFLLAVLALVSIRDIVVDGHYGPLKLLLVTLAVAAIGCGLTRYALGYDHVRAFLTAARLENPEGFRLLSDPLKYVVTRLEGVTEISLFASIGVFAVLLRQDYLGLRRFGFHATSSSLYSASLIVLSLMLLAGMFKTGETARNCLFIYPFLLLNLRNVRCSTLRSLTLIAGMQSLTMQTLGSYLW